jgi:hypothetical protein
LAAGLACYRVTRDGRASVRLGTVCLAVPIAEWIGYRAWAMRYGGLYGLAPDVFGRPELLADYGVGELFAIHLIGMCHLSEGVGRLLRPVAGPIRRLAAGTFPLYLVHYPVMQFVITVMPWPSREGHAGGAYHGDRLSVCGPCGAAQGSLAADDPRVLPSHVAAGPGIRSDGRYRRRPRGGRLTSEIRLARPPIVSV